MPFWGDMLVPWRVYIYIYNRHRNIMKYCNNYKTKFGTIHGELTYVVSLALKVPPETSWVSPTVGTTGGTPQPPPSFVHRRAKPNRAGLELKHLQRWHSPAVRFKSFACRVVSNWLRQEMSVGIISSWNQLICWSPFFSIPGSISPYHSY